MDQQEIANIAKELKRNLKPQTKAPEANKMVKDISPIKPKAATVPIKAVEQTRVEPQSSAPVLSPEEGILHLQAKMPADQPEEDADDTIFIDQEGKLHAKGEDVDGVS